MSLSLIILHAFPTQQQYFHKFYSPQICQSETAAEGEGMSFVVSQCAVWSLCSYSSTSLGNSLRLQFLHQRAGQLFHLPLFPLWHFTKIWRCWHCPIPAVTLTLWGPVDPSWELLYLFLCGDDLLWYTLSFISQTRTTGMFWQACEHMAWNLFLQGLWVFK